MLKLHESFKECNNLIFEEIDAFKNSIEKISETSTAFSPMLTFMSSSTERALTIVTPNQDTFDDTFTRIAEALHLYPAINAYSVVLAFSSKKQYDDNIYDSLNIFLLTDSFAGLASYPYTVNTDKTVTWHEQHAEMLNIDDSDFDPQFKDMLTMFFYFTHLEAPAYTTSEVLSYLSRIGCAINIYNNFDVHYYDFLPSLIS